MTLPNIRSVAADSNVLLSAVEGRAARRVLHKTGLVVVTTEENVAEVLTYLPEFVGRTGFSEERLHQIFAALPIEIFPKAAYASHLFQARSLLAARDPDDVPLAALALKLDIPVWSNDRDFDGFPTGVYPTAKLIKVLGV
ncbi:MAG TPA: PIN domain-containing protein [Thermoanaerobaculia bacterium]|nr:PIN domain-containing protein [Thermoanaerobaculia bacterium]